MCWQTNGAFNGDGKAGQFLGRDGIFGSPPRAGKQTGHLRSHLSWRKGEESAKRDTPRKGETRGDEVCVGTSLAAAIAVALKGEDGDNTNTMVMAGLGSRFFMRGL